MLETLRTAFRSLLSNKIRSALTMLGVIIGVGAVITMVAIGAGASANIQQYISGVGSNILIVMPGAPSSGGARQQAGSGASLTLQDAEALSRESFALRGVAPEIYSRSQLVYGNMNWSTLITGSTPSIFDIREWKIDSGRFFLEGEAKGGAKVVVLGATAAKNLFGGEDPVGKILRIRNVPMEVIGVMAPKGQTPWGQDQDDTAFVPLLTAQRRLFRRTAANSVQRITVSAIDGDSVSEAEREVRAILQQRHKTGNGREDDFDVRNMAEMLDAAAQSAKVMSLLLGAVASVSLLVGGIGIMNIMLVSVTERTREIGIRMAIGARTSDIRTQFLLEALLLSIAGGVIGILLGISASKIITGFLGWATMVSPGSVVLAFGFSVFVGIFFGFYPAWKASLLNPIEALRYE
ncbi:MAG: FtsX-like permease family protein [Synergistaceae bacterium]|nr:FtsX-like permease family protein [Synergistaceae bacterium]